MDHDIPPAWSENVEFTGNLTCSPQALPPMATAKPAGKSPLCKVCGDESSGFHYGVDSCEGCKGFFRRCITQGMTHKCANEEKCEITPFTRNSCQYCRLKKCFAVGMSREASRLGRRPKRLKDSSGESSKSHTNLPIAPYPSPAELYRLRMAELQKLLQANGTFKSELMQAFLSAAQASFREHAKHSGASQTHASSGGLESTGGQTDILNQNQYSQALLATESGYSSLSSPPETKCQSPLTDSMMSLNDNSPYIDNSSSIYGSTTPSPAMKGSGLASPTTPNYNGNGNYVIMSPYPQQVRIKTEPGLETTAACNYSSNPPTPTSDVNANEPSRGEKVLEEVKIPPSETRRLLIDQVTDAVVEAHIATCINTYANLAEANERLEELQNSQNMPDLSKLSLNAHSMWQQFLANMCPEITKVVTFCKKLPGFSEIEQEDQIKLIKQGSFEVLLSRFCMLIDHETEEMMDPAHKMKCPKKVILEMPMGHFFEEFFSIAAKFNPLKLTDGEIGLFTSILIICPERNGLKNKKATAKIQSLFQQALYYLMKKNHADPGHLFVKLMNTIPLFRMINEQHSKALNNIKMCSPLDYDVQFPALHKEVFDGKI